MLPQLDYSTYPSQLFWVVVSFTVLYAFVSCFVIPRLDSILEKRKEIILSSTQKTAENFERIKSEEEKYKSAINKARVLAKDIHRDNHLIVRDRKSEAYQKLSLDIKELHSHSNKQLCDFKDENKDELVAEAMRLTKLYYQKALSVDAVDILDIDADIKNKIEGRI